MTGTGPEALALCERAEALRLKLGATAAWTELVREGILPPLPFELQRRLFQTVFGSWDSETQGPAPAWLPSEHEIQTTNLFRCLREKDFSDYALFHEWSIKQPEAFWAYAIEKVGVPAKKPWSRILDLSRGAEFPEWLPGAKLNISDSCFKAHGGKTAIVFQPENGPLSRWSYAELNQMTNRVANGLRASGFQPGDALGIDMTMTAESVAIYLGIVRAGCVAVSIADSFAPEEIQTRLRISKAKAVFTQDFILRGGKILPLYEKVVASGAEKIIVVETQAQGKLSLRKNDLTWNAFLGPDTAFESVAVDPIAPSNILFSSGTTGDPKAIPWSHTTPIKCMVDAYFHHDVQPADVVAWPTNLGWMMGPWLIYAALGNQATIALYYGAPHQREFGEFVGAAGVRILGLVPSLVKAWRQSECMKGLNWTKLKAFSSTGECSNADDYLFLMSLANYRPVIEYCGGTEIGGGFATGTLLQPASPATFSTPALGTDLVILDEAGAPTNNGELFVVPPSLGFSLTLLNRDHHEVYFSDTPRGPQGQTLRRHGDQMERLPNGYFRAHGRADDTMNLGGIKVSSAEIERVLNTVDGISETAAIAVNPPGGGPSWLVIFAVVTATTAKDSLALKKPLQLALSQKLNPLFKIHEVRIVDSLPRTASNKVMRRLLRDRVSDTSTPS